MTEQSSTVPLAEGLEQQHVLQLLVQEAQQEIGNLRAELYSTRRLAEERRQGLDAMTNARDQLATVVHQLEERVQQMHGHLMQMPVLQQELHNLQELHKRLQRDSEAQIQARRILEIELQDERAGRSAAEEARAKAEAERSRLQLAQDDMMSQLRVARQKAADAEDDQLRAEEEAAVLRRELGVLQSQGSLGLSGPVPVAGDYGQQDSNAASLQVELDAQRARVTVLTDALSKLQVQAAATQAEVGQLKQQLQEAEGQAQKQLQRATQLDTALQALQHQSQQRQAKPGGTPAPGQQAGELQVLQLQLKQAHDQLAAADQQIKALQQKLAEAHAQVERAQADARAAIITASHHAVVSTAGSPAAAVKGSAASYATDDTDGGEAAAVLEEQVELLMNKLVVLKKSRDRMLAQLDRQSMENEQLLVESQALADSAQAAQQECQQWREQARDALATVARLQDLLAESASWEAGTAAGGGAMHQPGVSSTVDQDAQQVQDRPGAAATAAPGGSADCQAVGGAGPVADVARLHAALLQEQSKLTQRDLQVRVLSAQLLRAYGAYRGMARSLVPVLSNVEGKLLSLKAASSLMLRSGV